MSTRKRKKIFLLTGSTNSDTRTIHTRRSRDITSGFRHRMTTMVTITLPTSSRSSPMKNRLRSGKLSGTFLIRQRGTRTQRIPKQRTLKTTLKQIDRIPRTETCGIAEPERKTKTDRILWQKSQGTVRLSMTWKKTPASKPSGLRRGMNSPEQERYPVPFG